MDIGEFMNREVIRALRGAVEAMEEAVRRAAPGPLLEGELVSLSGRGNLRVEYDWLYSALNCSPERTSSFSWTISKTETGHVSLSPTELHDNRRLYASTRPDNDLYISVQAAISGDPITQVRGDEEYTLEALSGIIYRLKGFNGQYVTVDSQKTDHDRYSAFKVRSFGSTSSDDCLWALGVSMCIRPACGYLCSTSSPRTASEKSAPSPEQPTSGQTAWRS